MRRGEYMANTVLIFFGAGFGGILRYWVSNGIYLLLGRQFPYGTLLVNTTGCFLWAFYLQYV
jgi:CrcB protein